MRVLSSLAFFLTLCVVFTLGACANTPPEQAKLNANGQFDNQGQLNVVVGQPAPAFTLKDIQGADVSLAQFKGKQPVLLVFYRGSWCPFCIDQLEDYRRVLPDLKTHNIQLIAISPDAVKKNQDIAERFKTGYLFLSDNDSAVIQRYGIARDKKLPHPTLVLIDADGSVVWFYTDSDYQERPSASQLRSVIATHFNKTAPTP